MRKSDNGNRSDDPGTSDETGSAIEGDILIVGSASAEPVARMLAEAFNGQRGIIFYRFYTRL